MQVGNKPELERAELEAVLQSGIFSRAPNLASFLQYICERHLEGHADQIKEYSIAVEALGRPADFDQKKDSIVRVEAHKLRKRLSEYYSGAGADHEIHILIPNGQYAPQFVAHEAARLPAEPQERTIEVVPQKLNAPGLSTSLPEAKQMPSRLLIPGIVAAFVAIGAVAWLIGHKPKQQPPPQNEVWTGPVTQPLPGEVRFLAGYHGNSFQDPQGRTWGPDAYYTGGRSVAVRALRLIQAQPQPNFIRSEREGRFRYDIPLRDGTYELHLLFAETEYGQGNPAGGAESDRLFRISVNGQVKADNFDVIAEAGAANRLHCRVFKDITPASDGRLHVNFDPIQGQAFLNALQVLPTLPGKIRPIRLVAQSNSVTDEAGQVWSADEYVTGGRLVVRRDSVSNVREKSIYDGERYGNFSYRIPLAPGKYKLTLHFAETYFGTPQTAESAIGSRSFNLFANGTALLRDFDIAKTAGGANRAIEETFQNLEPNAQGVLMLEFVPVKNYACINALEITETD